MELSPSSEGDCNNMKRIPGDGFPKCYDIISFDDKSIVTWCHSVH